MAKDRYHYWAFISYSSKDEAVARRLHRALEHYRMPRDLVGRPMRDGEPAPNRLFPVFRDRDELPLSADLGDAIESALQVSRYLIVLCSPSAAASRWVNEEVRYFKSIGGEDRILAIILSGEPNASDKAGSTDEECFPPALRFGVDLEGRLTNERCEPIAGDLRKGGDGWKACVLKAVAGITGLGLAAFTKREQVRARRRAILMAGAALLLTGGATAWWDYTRTKVAYYAHLTDRFGVPTGVMAVPKADLMHRNSTYVVESSRGKVRRVLRVNGSGHPADDEDAPFQAASRELVYREDGSLQTIDFLSRQGRVTARREFSQPRETAEGLMIIAETKTENDGAPLSIDVRSAPAGGTDAGKSEASVTRSIYQKDGLPFRAEYLNTYRNFAPDSQGISGKLFEYGKDGLLVGTVFTGADGRPHTSREGVCSIRLVRDERGNPIEKAYFGTDGQPVADRNDVAKWTSKFDERGNQVEESYFGTDGQPIMAGAVIGTTVHGYAKWTAGFDERGNETERAYFGTDGQPAADKNDVAKWTSKFDERGNETERAYFGTDGQPVVLSGIHLNGYAKWTSKFDERGNLIEMAYFGTDGQPVALMNGYSKVTAKFDERGNLTEKSYFGTDGQPVVDRDGYAKATAKIDERGNRIEMAFFGTDGQPVMRKEGIAKWTSKFDERGNEIERAYFDTDGQPVLQTDGNARWTAKFDERGNRIEMAYFGTDGQPVALTDGYAKVTSKFDERGNRIEEAYFGTDGQPVMITDGWLFYAKRTAKFDGRGNQIEKSYFGTDGKLIFSQAF